MRLCPQCRHEVGEARFCPQCGERLVAEEAAPVGRSAMPVVVLVGVLLMALAVPLGGWLLFRSPDSPERAVDPGEQESETVAAAEREEPEVEPAGDPTRSPEAEDRSDAEESAADGEAEKPEETDEAAPSGPARPLPRAETQVPGTAPAGVDVRGNRVSYAPANLLDGDRTTAWRMAGDGTARTLTFRLPSTTAVTRVGMVNGYAKTSGAGDDWYRGNRRVLEVEWRFDDGTTVRQSLDGTRRMQTVGVDEAVTETVELRLLEVSDPGRGAASRDYTAISELTLVGRTSP